MISIIFAIVVGVAALILVHELGHFAVAKLFNVRVDEFGFGFPPRIASWKKGETLYSINIIPFGGFVRLHGEDREEGGKVLEKERAFFFQKPWKRGCIIVAGITMNIFAGWIIFSAVFMVGTQPAVIIAGVTSESPAAEAGLMRGDVLVEYQNVDAFIAAIAQGVGEEMRIVVQRNGTQEEIIATPDKSVGGGGVLGISLVETGMQRLGIMHSIWEGLKEALRGVVAIVVGITTAIAHLVSGRGTGVDVVGPVGIFAIASQAGQLGGGYLLQLIGIISLNLAVINALPFPALDGGRLFFILLEKIKGSPLSLQVERAANGLGFAALLLLMVVITVRDVIGLL